MPVRITNLVKIPIPLGDPVNDVLQGEEIKDYPYVEYDKLRNDIRFWRLHVDSVIFIQNLDSGAFPVYDSAWNGPNRFRLGTFQIWVDGTGALRMKNGDATSDTDGYIIGPTAVAPHGPTHEFTGTDPIPRIEVLENQWNCTVAEAVLDVVFESSSNTVRKANATNRFKMPGIGIIINKPTPTTCIIARSGEVGGFSGLTVDVPYFVDTVDGQITTTIHVGSGNVVQRIGYSKTTTTIVVDLGQARIRA